MICTYLLKDRNKKNYCSTDKDNFLNFNLQGINIDSISTIFYGAFKFPSSISLNHKILLFLYSYKNSLIYLKLHLNFLLIVVHHQFYLIHLNSTILIYHHLLQFCLKQLFKTLHDNFILINAKKQNLLIVKTLNQSSSVKRF